jgi:hypothetical protein
MWVPPVLLGLIGAYLARLDARILFEGLLNKIPDCADTALPVSVRGV